MYPIARIATLPRTRREDARLDQAGRNRFMDSLDESHELFALGDQVCGDERVWQLLEQYVAKHQALFRSRSSLPN